MPDHQQRDVLGKRSRQPWGRGPWAPVCFGHCVMRLNEKTNFTAAYLLSHGVIKLWLIVGLLREKLWYYPLAIAIFALFIVYQLYRFNLSHSLWLVLITMVDVVVIVLTWQEYRYRRRPFGRPRYP